MSKTFFQEMTPAERKSFHAIITEVVREVVKSEINDQILSNLVEHRNQCRFDISEESAREFMAVANMIASVGNGKILQGVEVLRENHKWLKKQRERSEKLSTAFLVVLISSFITGVLASIWAGLTTILAMKGGS